LTSTWKALYAASSASVSEHGLRLKAAVHKIVRVNVLAELSEAVLEIVRDEVSSRAESQVIVLVEVSSSAESQVIVRVLPKRDRAAVFVPMVLVLVKRRAAVLEIVLVDVKRSAAVLVMVRLFVVAKLEV
jgi:hypothetical protein